MKVLFITDDYIIDPLGIGWLSAYLKQAGHDVGIHKLVGKTNPILEHEPDMVCYSVTTGRHGYYRDMNLALKNSGGNFVSVFGGPHVTFFPEFAKEEGVDIAVRGEGFDAIVDIANALETGDDISTIPNVVGNNLRPSKDKATLLPPDRELIYGFPKNRDNPIKNVMASFFCPFSCSYCYNPRHKEMYGIHRSEIRPMERVAEEIEQLREYPLGLIFFNDDIFPLYDHKWLDDFCFYYSGVGLPFHIQLRVEYIKDDAIRRLKEVGLHGVTFAIESGNARLREEILERHFSNDRVEKAAAIVHKYGIKLRTENMVGVPGETWGTAMQTLSLNTACQPEIAWASLYQPYPGTKLGDRCVTDGLFNGDLDSMSESFFDTYKLNVSEGKKFERLQKLFSFMAKYPRLRAFLPLLVRLPFRYGWFYSKVKARLYKQLYKVAKDETATV